MKTPPRQLAFFARIPDKMRTPPPLEDGGIWTFGHDGLDRIDSAGVTGAIVLAPAEAMLMLVVDLPLPSRARRLTALPFAVEDAISEPIEAVHVALGEEVSPGRFLAAVVRHDIMRAWISQMDDAGMEQAALVPDPLSLTRPAEGCWSVLSADTRAIVRASDGSGFAIPTGHVAMAWQAAGRPVCTSYGSPLPAGITAEDSASDRPALASFAMSPALNLRQGQYAPPRRAAHPLWRRIAISAAVGALAHGAIALADTVALSRIAAQREADVRVLAATKAPGMVIGDDMSGLAADMASDGGSAIPGSFLPLMERTARALQAMGSPLQMQAIVFDAAAGTLALDIQAQDIATLQKVAGALTAAGLSAESGSASVDQGKATGTFTVRVP